MLEPLAPGRSARLGPDGAVIGLGDEEGAGALGLGAALSPHLGLARGQRGEDLLLIALDTLRSRHDRDELRETLQPGQPEDVKPLVQAGIRGAARAHPPPDDGWR